MALWKKILIWFAVAVAPCLIIFYVNYTAIVNLDFVTITPGDYVLTRIYSYQSGDPELVEEFSEKTYYLTLTEDNDIISHSGDRGVRENEDGYIYVLIGEELAIYYNNDEGSLAYQGVYREGSNRLVITSGVLQFIYVLEGA